MALDVTGLADWTDEHQLELIAKSVLKGRTIDLINLQTGIKQAATINLLSSAPIFQAGSCGWNATGTTSLTQQTITVCPIKLNEPVCLDDLEAKYTSEMMRPGSYNEDIPFEQLYSDEKASQVSSFIDNLIWAGDVTGTTVGQLHLCDGFLTIALNDATVITVTGMTFASGTIVAEMDSIVAAIPEDVIDAEDMTIFISYANYRTYARALRDANLFHYDGQEDQGLEFSQMIPGTNVRVTAVKGMSAVNVLCSPASNLYYGTDLTSDSEDFRIFYSEDNDEVRFRANFKVGVNFAFPDFVVLGVA